MLEGCLKRKPPDSTFIKNKDLNTHEKCALTHTSGRSVTFADCFGKRLEFVKIISPSSSYEDLNSLAANAGHHSLQRSDCGQHVDRRNYNDWNNNELIFKSRKSRVKQKNPVNFLARCLPQPLFRRDFEYRFERNNICLENLFVASGSSNVLIAVIRVKNIAYRKDIFLRYTLNRWRNYHDESADFAFQCNDGQADKFLVRMEIRPDFIGQELNGMLEFAICYKVNRSVFWDNNNGRNYKAKYFARL